MTVVALAIFVLLPGLLVARAPWTAVPSLSLAFWALSVWWSPPWLSRTGFLGSALVVWLLLLVLRALPKHEVPPPPGWSASPPAPPARSSARPPATLRDPACRLVALGALCMLAPAPLWHNAPGQRLAFQTTAARLVLWRDGLPLSSEPLLPLDAFGAHAPAVATLAADVARVCGVDPARAVVVVLLLGAALALVGLFGLLSTRLPPLAAALAALLAVAALASLPALAPGRLSAPWAVESVIALAFVLPASTLLVGHASWPATLAAAWLMAAGALVQPSLAASAGAACGFVVLVRGAGERSAAVRRLGLAACATALLAEPALQRLAGALSLRESAAMARALWPAGLVWPALALAVVAAAAALATRLAGRARRDERTLAWTLAIVSALGSSAAVNGWIARGQLPEPLRRALQRIDATAGPFEVICARGEVRDWIPAIAGRAVEPGPWVPAVYGDESSARGPRACSAAGDILSRGAGKPSNGSGVLIERRGDVTLPTR